MSEPLSCPDPDCDGVFTIPDAPGAKSLCSVCNLTWDRAADTAAPAVEKTPGLEGSMDTERARWADAQVRHPALDDRKERPKLLEWYKQFDVLKRNPSLRYEKVLELLRNDPELHNDNLRYASATFVCWLKRFVIEANNRAWPAHDDYDEGESLRVLAARTYDDHPLRVAFQAAVQDLEQPSPDLAKVLCFPAEWLRNGIREIGEDEYEALDAESKASCAENNVLYTEFEALMADPGTAVLFSTRSHYLHEAPISDALDRWARDVCAEPIRRPRGAPPKWAHRDARIVRAIERLCDLGMKATRNDKSSKYSACDAVAEVMPMSYDMVKRIWKRSRRRASRRSSSR